MKHRYGVLGGVIVVLLVLVAGLSPAWAARDNLADFGFRAGYQRFADQNKGGLGAGLFLRIPWRSVILTEGAVFYYSTSVDDGDLEFIPVHLSLQIYPLRRDLTYCPYLLGGIGATITRAVPDEGDTDTDVDMSWHLGLGLDYVFSERMFAEFDARYIWLDADFGDQTVGDKLSDFNQWIATLGIGFRL